MIFRNDLMAFVGVWASCPYSAAPWGGDRIVDAKQWRFF